MPDEKTLTKSVSWRATILWALALSVAVGGGIWAGAYWKRHASRAPSDPQSLMQSEDEAQQIKGIFLAAGSQLRPGMTLDEVRRVFPHVRIDGPLTGGAGDVHKSADGQGFYLVHPLTLEDGVAMTFDKAGRLVRWWTVP